AVPEGTPYQLWHGRKPDISHLRVWGWTAYVHVQRDKRRSLGSHVEKPRSNPPPSPAPPVGVYVPDELDEPLGHGGENGAPPAPPAPQERPQDVPGAHNRAPTPPPPPSRSPSPPGDADEGQAPPDRPSTPPCRARSVPAPQAPTRCSARDRTATTQWWKLDKPRLYPAGPAPAGPAKPLVPVDEQVEVVPDSEEEDDADTALAVHGEAYGRELALQGDSYKEPRTYAEAVAQDPLWYDACVDEMGAHWTNGTWEVVTLPPGEKAIGSRWVFKLKRNADGSIERRLEWLPKASPSVLASTTSRSSLPLSASPPFASSCPPKCSHQSADTFSVP
ncbi:hypothetical protein CONPUDRAFT_152019, partial [Coniophora puteana RWD-64-598 SS2]